MKERRLVMAAACAAAAGLAAQKAAPGDGTLDLTESQKSQSQVIYQDAWKTARPLVEQIRENRKALAEAVKATDMGKVRQLADQQGDLTGQWTVLRAGAQAQFCRLLTPEQRNKLDMMKELARSRRAQWAQWRQRWRKIGAQ